MCRYVIWHKDVSNVEADAKIRQKNNQIVVFGSQKGEIKRISC